jgi:hypothetical protein
MPNQISVIVAAFVYNAAMRDQMLPRKPIENTAKGEPETQGEGSLNQHCVDSISSDHLVSYRLRQNQLICDQAAHDCPEVQ